MLLILFATETIYANILHSNIGIRVISADFPQTNNEIKGIIWYPTLEKAQNTKLDPFEEMVAKNAEIKKGKHVELKKDRVLRYPYHAESIRQKLSIKPEYVIVKNANHYSFLAPFPENSKRRFGVIAKDHKGFDRVKFHLTMNQEIYEFLNKSLGKK